MLYKEVVRVGEILLINNKTEDEIKALKNEDRKSYIQKGID